MKILLVYPETPSTFWSFKDALKFVSKKSAEPPLGLITVAAMLPIEWEKKLIDMNVSTLRDKDLLWADYIFLSAMNIHAYSVKDIVKRCNKLGVKIVAGGPLFTTQYQDFLGIDHFVLNEAEITLPMFLKDLESGTQKHLYKTDEFPDVSLTPMPMWELLDRKKYASMSLQYSRGCPYDCEFCSITMLNGRIPRTKSKQKFLGELDRLFELGYRGDISVVDDNFIGNKKKLKDEILPALIKWLKEKKYPFHFVTEVSINLADDEKLMDLMVEAGFYSIFVGIETPNDESLAECGKSQNQKRDLVSSVKKLQQHGMVVSAGFIIGFDNDPPDIFERQINFIRQSGIAAAMVGLLNAPSGTHLFERLKKENRLLDGWSGNNMDGATNFRPKMNYRDLVAGYSKIIRTIYSPQEYYKRVKTFLNEYTVPAWKSQILTFTEIKAFIKLLWLIGILEEGRRYFWRNLVYSLFKYPKKFSLAMTLTVYGYHFRRIAATI
ncbi:MAG: B12-binding domain-containing radical SAM protein [Ignavibacteriae bacterium HGW-Ignavibacteriae-3]|nr:MAG: B12-binding domain-containing radical SAM protein [Ignavibacteriae bacterium HGW-Ignavibacteriae-3]